MQKFFLKKKILGSIFLIFLFVFSVLNFKDSYEPLKDMIGEEMETEQKTDYQDFINTIEAEIYQNVYKRYEFIEAFGYLQRLMGKNEQSNFETVKDTTGSLHHTHFADEPNDVRHLAGRVRDFKLNMADKDTKFIYLMPPDKYIKGYTEFPTGIPYNFANETADDFLKLLEQEDITTIDLRESITKSGIPADELFYKTDHHWKIETNFWAFAEFVNQLKEIYNVNLDEDHFYTNIDNYNVVTYPHLYLGSLGRKTGKYYAGADDFTIIYPMFKTNYDFRMGSSGLDEYHVHGRFEDVLLSSYVLQQNSDPYAIENDKYYSYLLGNRGISHIKNNDNPNGAKMAFIKDSMVVPMISFLSTVCSDIYFIDPRYYQGDIPDFIDSLELDFLVFSFYPQNIVDEFFPFYQNS